MKKIIAILVALLACMTLSKAANLTLTWDNGGDTNTLGYRLDWESETGLGVMVDLGNSTTYTVENLREGVTYHFCIIPYDRNKNDGHRSNVIIHTPKVKGTNRSEETEVGHQRNFRIGLDFWEKESIFIVKIE